MPAARFAVSQDQHLNPVIAPFILIVKEDLNSLSIDIGFGSDDGLSPEKENNSKPS